MAVAFLDGQKRSVALSTDTEASAKESYQDHTHTMHTKHEQLFGAVRAGAFLEVSGRLVPAIMGSNSDGQAHVCREAFRPQFVALDSALKRVKLHESESNDSMQWDESFDRTQLSDPSQSYPEDEASETLATRYHGTVFCLLLYTGTSQGITQACVLNLGKVRDGDSFCYQRLGLGCGWLEGWHNTGYNRFRYWAEYMGFAKLGDLGEWEEWEEWFADAEMETIRLV
jgi:hypothetical protein